MPICKRDKCSNEVGYSFEEKKKRICHEHYQRWLHNKERRRIKKKSKCEYCKRTLENLRGSRFCSREHKRLYSRIINDDYIVKLVSYSYWKYIERFIKRNPFGLGSIEGPNDVVDTFLLYRDKARFQRSYNVIKDEIIVDKDGRPVRKLVPWIYLDICHIYPNSLGGCNNAKNEIIAPTLINKKLHDKLPMHQHGRPYGGGRSEHDSIIIKEGGLLRALVNRYGKEDVMASFRRIGPLKHLDYKENIYHTLPNRVFLPLMNLLRKECQRLSYNTLAEKLNELVREFNCYPKNIELFAVVCFYAILTGDRDGLIGRVERFKFRWLSIKKHVDGNILSEHYHHLSIKYYHILLERYLMSYFSIDLNDNDETTNFYNEFFSTKEF